MDLLLVNLKPEPGVSLIKGDIGLFLILFGGTAAVIWVLLNSLNKQLIFVKQIQRETEISQQRYRTAIEGKRGGIWEINIEDGTAFVSGSLAGLLGLLNKDQKIPIADFLNLFIPQDREAFLSHARRGHLQNEFEFDVRVAKYPYVLQCRGRSSLRSGAKQKRILLIVC